MRKFAKLYETDVGQIVVMRQTGDEGPEIVFFFDANTESVGYCKFGISFEDSDDGSNKADRAFEATNEEGVTRAIRDQIDMIKRSFGGDHAA